MSTVCAITYRTLQTLGRQMFIRVSFTKNLSLKKAVLCQGRPAFLTNQALFWPCYQPSFTNARWLATTGELKKKDGGKDGDEHGQSPTTILPKDATGKDSPGGSKRMVIVSPQTVQVFADANMAQTVREVAVDIQKLKGQLTFFREEFSDCSFEVLKLSQGRSAVVAALKETRKFCRDNQSAVVSLKTEQKKLDQLITYISKMVARHENQLNDAKKLPERDAAVCKKLDGLSQRIDKTDKSIRAVAAVNEGLQVDVKKIATDIKQLQNGISRVELEVKYRGREIAELKSKRPIDLLNTK